MIEFGFGGFGGPGSSGAAYASPIAIDFDGQRQYVQLTAKALIGDNRRRHLPVVGPAGRLAA